MLKACEKSSWWLWKESSVSICLRKPGNTFDCNDMTLAVTVVLDSIRTNQLIAQIQDTLKTLLKAV